MALLVHLSDLHMTPVSGSQAKVFDALVVALARERARAEGERAIVAITGDVFDSSTLPPRAAVAGFLRLHERIVTALGGDAPTIVLPGNHDRRRFGLLGPSSEGLFRALRDAVDPARVHVAGCDPPLLAHVVPRALHGLALHVIAYDSTYLPGGLVGAGGTLRLEDLLMAAAQLPDDGVPLLVLTHHHLIPTPLTDISHIDSARSPRVAKWVVRQLLPALVAYGDREELTMTAMGAGTVLSTLHTLGRAVLLLHGHKHVPTARLVAGMSESCGDVLLASAGSAGTRERVHATRHPDAARLWPSFNVVRLGADHVRVEALSFSPKHGDRAPVRRPLASARAEGIKWKAEPVSFRVRDAAARVELDEAIYRLEPSTTAECWDYECERRVTRRPGARLRRYVEFLHAPAHVPVPIPKGAQRHIHPRIELALDGVTRFRQKDGLCRTLAMAARARGAGTAFEWVGLLSRYGAARAVLRLARSGAAGLAPFGSVTDLTIGRERPVRLQIDDDFWTVSAESCAPRSLLRIYWPLAVG